MKALQRLSPFLLLLGMGAGAAVAGAAEPPATMQAAAIDHAGGAELLTLKTLPVPRPDAGEVLIAVHTAGVGS